MGEQLEPTKVQGSRKRVLHAGVLVAIVVTVVVGALSLDRGQSSPPSSEDVDASPNPPTAEQIIDNPSSTIDTAKSFASGLEYAVWLSDCDDEPCPVAVGWSDDGWATRATALVPVEADFLIDAAGLIVMPWTERPYIVGSDGTTVQMLRPGPAAPLRQGEIVLEQALRSPRWLYLDPVTGESHRILPPPQTQVGDITLFETGELRVTGSAPGATWLLAKSFDGGETWKRMPLPIPFDAGGYGHDETHVQVAKFATTLYMSSSNAGLSWSRVLKRPFTAINCTATAHGTQLYLSTGQMWRTTNDAWTRFERLPDAPELDCLESEGDIVTGMGADSATVYVSTDAGTTWTATNPG